MLKLECKIIELIEKHILLVSVVISCLLAFYLRRVAVWWIYPEVGYAFDMHMHHVESSLYYMLVSLTEYIPMLPLHSIKWVAALSDYVLALQCSLLVNDKIQKWQTKEVIFFIMCLFSPVLFMRGILWGRLDSLAMVLLLSAYMLYKHEKIIFSIIIAILAVGLYPCLLVVVIAYLLYSKEKFALRNGIIVVTGTILLLEICSLYLGERFGAGLETLLNWSTYEAISGNEMKNVVEWMYQMIICFGLPICVISTVMAFKQKIHYLWAIIFQAVVTVLYGSVLFV